MARFIEFIQLAIYLPFTVRKHGITWPGGNIILTPATVIRFPDNLRPPSVELRLLRNLAPRTIKLLPPMISRVESRWCGLHGFSPGLALDFSFLGII